MVANSYRSASLVREAQQLLKLATGWLAFALNNNPASP
jgi:hypothetical protein